MTRMVIAGNWKMHHGPSAARQFFEAFSPNLAKGEPRIVIFPPAISLSTAAEALRGRPEVDLGIQNIHWQPQGAFTGEHSARMAMVAGARYALVGHSERRHVFGETDAEVELKVSAANAELLTPVVCVGETLEERLAGRVEEIIVRQLDAALSGFSQEGVESLLVAYEPVWAIGTGEIATADDVVAAHGILRSRLRESRGDTFAAAVPLLYGGSVNSDNAADLLSLPDVNGVLVGGASLDADSFAKIAEAGST